MGFVGRSHERDNNLARLRVFDSHISNLHLSVKLSSDSFAYFLQRIPRLIKRVVKILVLSLADASFSDIGAISSPNKKRYADKHGYDFICVDYVRDSNRSASWNKILWLEKLLPEYDWVFWTDADSLVMNCEIRLEDIIGDSAHDLILTRDENGLNAGQFLIRNCYWSLWLLGSVWNQIQFLNHAWSEQAALMHVLRVMSEPHRTEHVRFLPSKNILNSYCNHYRSDYQPGDFIVHFAGMTQYHEHLKTLMLEWQPKAF